MVDKSHLHVADIYLPPEALTNRNTYICKPSSFVKKQCNGWLESLLGRQSEMLAGEPVKTFHWTRAKASYVGKLDEDYVPAIYNPEFMLNYAFGHAHPPGVEQSSSRFSTTPSDVPPSRATTPPASAASTPPSSRASSALASTPTSQTVRSVSSLARTPHSAVPRNPSPLRSAARPIVLSPPPLSPSSALPSRSESPVPMPTPATETSSTLLPPDLDALLANFGKSSTEETSVIVPGIVSLSWCENIAERKYAYLTGLTNNHHYRQIAEWYVSQKVRVLISFQGLIYKSKYLIACAANHRSLTTWLSWNYTSPHLPSDVHASKAKIAEVFSHLSTWCKSPVVVFNDHSILEAHLLLLGLMYRDMDMALYEHDPDGGGYD